MKKLSTIIFVFLCSYSFGDVTVPKEYYSCFVTYCMESDVPIEYATRLIAYESGWNPKFINKNSNGTKDYGLAQLNSSGLWNLQQWHNDGKPFDPMNWKDNLRIGIKHMRFLYDRNGQSWWASIACYNMGERAFREWCDGKRPLPEGTQRELNFVFQ